MTSMTAGKDRHFRDVSSAVRADGFPVPHQSQVQILPPRSLDSQSKRNVLTQRRRSPHSASAIKKNRNVAQVNGRVRIAHILMRSEMQVQVLPFRLALWLSKHPTCMDALRKRRGKPRVTRSHSARTVMVGQFIRFPPLTEIRGA